MIFVDTNIVLDLIGSDRGDEAAWSRGIVAGFGAGERLVCNLVVVAEVAGRAAAPAELTATLLSFGIAVVDLDLGAAVRAGQAFREYRRRGGPRTAILADFLIGGHAVSLGAALMTRDRRLATYFPDLPLITPESQP